MSILWTATEAAAATGGRAQGGSTVGDWTVGGVSIDTRTLQPGDLFVALKAERDGHDFVAQALAKGAGAALVSHLPEGVAPDAPLLVVPDVLEALTALGRAGRARTGAKVIAITGSVGKTSSKEMIRAALQGEGRVHAAEASYNNHWGVPLTLARMPADTEFAVIEIGMNHPGEIEPLARLARPHVALITTVAAVHLEAFGEVAGIAHEKGAIFAGLEPAGTAILPEDLAVTQILRDCADAAGAIVIGFGAHGMGQLVKAEVKGEIMQIRARILGQMVDYTLESAGMHFAMNSVGALTAIHAAGIDIRAAAQRLSAWRPYKGRGAVEELGGIRLIDDSYNSNPTSLSAGLATLTKLSGGRHVAILGDMLELGPDEIEMHRAMAEDGSVGAVDLFHLAGHRMRSLYEALPEAKRGLWTEDASGLAAQAADLVATGDIVLVKGSKSSKISTVVDALRRSLQSSAPEKRG